MESPATGTLTAWLFETPLAVEAAELRVRRIQERKVATVHDWVSVIWFEGDDEPRTRQHHSTGKAAGKGTLWGVVIGSVLGGPIAGAVVGAAAATAGHRMLGSAVPGDFVADVRERIRPGSSALLVLSEPLAPETVSAISAGDPHVTVLRTDVATSDEGTPAG